VFEVQPRELIAAARALVEGEAPFGVRPATAPDFFIGALATIFDPVTSWSPKSLAAKLDAGAQFVQTQPCLDAGVLRRYVKRLVAAQLPRRAHILVAVPVLDSADAARRLRDSARSALIPDAAIHRLARAADPEREGIEIVAEALREFAAIPGVSGAALAASGTPGTIAAAIEASGLRRAAPASSS
jgi:methylenetetrahydrofolate reductase (NADPH)